MSKGVIDMHPFGGLYSHPFGGTVAGLTLPSTFNASGAAGNATAPGGAATQLATSKFTAMHLQNNAALLQAQLAAFKANVRKAPALAATAQTMQAGGVPAEESFFEKYKTYILAGGAVVAVAAIALFMRRK